ncbi:putative 50 kDa protein in type I retrotransposable element R1DM [Lucilia cuprina]|nr:putative 50 kDa protein in type I retrotransposable element R1DM [Lucilia cuprina]
MAPAPASKRKGKGKADKSDISADDPTTSKPMPKRDASDTTAFDFEPPVATRRLRHTESEMSSTETEEVANNLGKGAVVAAASRAGIVASSSAKIRIVNLAVVSAKDITQAMMEAVLVDGLKGRLEVLEAVQSTFKVPAVPAVVSRTASAARRVPVVPATSAAVAPAANLPKPVETWSVTKRVSPQRRVVEKVVKEVGPTLCVRVHELRPLRRSDGSVIRTPSVAVREKVAANEKFGEVGLEVSVNDKLGPMVVVQRVDPEITPDEFMGELYDLNFRRRMTPEEFIRSVRLVSNPWKPTGDPVSVILEAMQQLLDNGRCYIKWFSFMVRPHDAVPSCFRCLGFDHRVRECRITEGVCRLCGQVGHMSATCPMLALNDKLGPKVVVQRVHPEITPDEFVGELYDLNFRRRMTPEEFKRSVRLVSNPWKPTGGPVSVILEDNNEAMQQFLDNGRCYIKCFSFMVRPHDAVPSCFRCLGFDHRVRECRMTEGVCRLCGQVGHMASRCVNEIHCRNCAFKGLPADHLILFLGHQPRCLEVFHRCRHCYVFYFRRCFLAFFRLSWVFVRMLCSMFLYVLSGAAGVENMTQSVAREGGCSILGYRDAKTRSKWSHGKKERIDRFSWILS